MKAADGATFSIRYTNEKKRELFTTSINIKK